ncbi:cytochrome C peroxidase, partial [Rhodococcus sp. IITR03]
STSRESAAAGAAHPRSGGEPVAGPSGNVEYFLWLRAGEPGREELDPAVIELIERAVQEGPQ